MTTFLFWNIHRRRVEHLVASVALRHEVDVVILAECGISAGVMLKALNENADRQFHLTRGGRCKRIIIYTRLPRFCIEPVEQHSQAKFTFRRLRLPETDVLLVAAHLSRLFYKEADKASECRILARAIRDAEDMVGHKRTVLIGDLNANPFEEGVVVADGLHAMMSRRVASRGGRRVAEKTYPFFYNPMWGCFGESADHPLGTFYHPGSTYKEFFWHMTDQVLLRPDLMALFQDEDLKVLTMDGDRSFLTRRGLPDASIASDHLPVLFRLSV